MVSIYRISIFPNIDHPYRWEQSSPTKWLLAVVETMHPGRDAKVQVVTIRTCKGMYTHPVTKLVPLVDNDSMGLSADR